MTTNIAACCLLFCLIIPACSKPDALSENTAGGTVAVDTPLQLSDIQMEALNAIDEFGAEKAAVRQAETYAKKSMERVLFDPGSAMLTQVRAGKSGSACGKVNAKNRYGAYVGYKDFVVDKDGEVFISSNNDGLESEALSAFAVAYQMLCATKQEAAEYAARLAPSRDTLGQQSSREPDEILDAPIDASEVEDVPTT